MAVIGIPAANTGPTTVNFDAIGVKAVKRINSDDLIAGDLPANAIVTVVYNATKGWFELQTLPGDAIAAAASAAAAATSATNAATSETNAAATLTNAVLKDGTSVMTGPLKVTPTGTHAFEGTSTDAGAASGPANVLKRLSGSPATNDLGGAWKAFFHDSALAEVIGTEFKARLRVATAGAVETAWEAYVQNGAGSEIVCCAFGKDGLEDIGGYLVQSLKSSQATTVTASGTIVAFTGISADATKIIVTVRGLQNAGPSARVFRLVLGDSGGYETSGYAWTLSVRDGSSDPMTGDASDTGINLIS